MENKLFFYYEFDDESTLNELGRIYQDLTHLNSFPNLHFCFFDTSAHKIWKSPIENIFKNEIAFGFLEYFSAAPYKINSIIQEKNPLFSQKLDKDFLLTNKYIEYICKKHYVSVVLTCHSKYLRFLPECLQNINIAVNFDDLILVLDGCSLPSTFDRNLLKNWRIYTGEGGDPNPARNLGLAESKNDWVVFFDADNVISADYLSICKQAIKSAKTDIAFLYPDLFYFYNDINVNHKTTVPPNWEYWIAREKTFIDTSSCWRKLALNSINGWKNESKCYDDLKLVLDLSKNGWRGQPNRGKIYIREHDLGRRSISETPIKQESLWLSRSIGIVTLLAGRDNILEKWFNSLFSLELPPNCSLFLVDNSNDNAFNSRVYELTKIIKNRFQAVTILKSGQPFPIDEKKYTYEPRHQHVANLYNLIFSYVNTDLVFTLEDDIIPVNSNILKKLSDVLHINTDIGLVGATYRSGNTPERATTALDLDKWTGMPMYNELTEGNREVGFVAGGATLYQNSALKKVLPLRAYYDDVLFGWDGYLCKKFRKLGYKIVLAQDIRCHHYAWGEKELLA